LTSPAAAAVFRVPPDRKARLVPPDPKVLQALLVQPELPEKRLAKDDTTGLSAQNLVTEPGFLGDIFGDLPERQLPKQNSPRPACCFARLSIARSWCISRGDASCSNGSKSIDRKMEVLDALPQLC
jgi:hypothetical protein